MNIVYYVDEYPPFSREGLGTYAKEITKEFVRQGNDVTVFSRNTGDSPTKEKIDGVEVHRPLLADIRDILPIMVPEDVKGWPVDAREFFGEMFLYNIFSYSELVNALISSESKDVDIVVSHDWPSALVGIISKEGLKKPFVFHLHSTEHSRTKNGSPTVKEIESIAGRKADCVITVSYAMGDGLIKLGHDEKLIRVVYNAVDPVKYSIKRFSKEEVKNFRMQLGTGGDYLVILFISRLTWVKGADTLVQTIPLILKEIPNAKLVLLGKGDQEKMIEHLVTNLGIQKSVVKEFKYVNEEDRILHYAACDIVVFPSKYEPFGIVCTEAMSMGKPVVVGAKGTLRLREQVIPSGPEMCGFHIDPYNPADIAKFVVGLLKDEELRKKLGTDARDRVLKNFTWEKIATETLRVYEEALP